MCREIIWVRVKVRVMGRGVPEFTLSVLYRDSPRISVMSTMLYHNILAISAQVGHISRLIYNT
jgi:hypothetical protein